MLYLHRFLKHCLKLLLFFQQFIRSGACLPKFVTKWICGNYVCLHICDVYLVACLLKKPHPNCNVAIKCPVFLADRPLPLNFLLGTAIALPMASSVVIATVRTVQTTLSTKLKEARQSR